MIFFLLGSLIAGYLGGGIALAEEPDFFGQIKFGESISNAQEKAGRFSLWGELGYRLHYAPRAQFQGMGYRRQDSEITSSRADLRLKMEGQVNDKLFLQISGRTSYDDTAVDPELEGELDETFIDVETGFGTRLKFGRQLVVFGESDYFQVVDVVNPRDEREPGLAELDETRLPVFASRLSYIGRRWGADLALLHEFRPNRLADAGEDFDLFVPFGGFGQLIQNPDPELDFANPDVIVRGFASFPRGDISLVLAETHLYSPAIIGLTDGRFVIEYPRSFMAGFAANYVYGHWVFKVDYARREGVPFLRGDIEQQTALALQPVETALEKTRHDVALGFRYSGINDLSISVEVLNQYIENYQAELSDPRFQSSSVVDVTWETPRDKLSTSLFWGQWWGDAQSGLARLRFEYDFNDEVSLYGGYIDYFSADREGLLYSQRRNDRLFLGGTYAF